MKQKIVILMLLVFLLIAITSSSFAGGDQVRGDNGQGEVKQVQVQDPPPFN